VAVLPDDPEEVRVRKASLILLVALIVPLSTVWVVTYAILGLWWSAVIPLAYQVLSAVGLVALLRTKRFQRFLTVELSLMLLLPFVLQWSLGGFRASSTMAAWAFVAPMAALVFVGPRRAWSWLAGYGVLLVASTVLEFTEPDATQLPRGVVISFFFLNISGLSLVTYLLLRYFVQERERALAALDQAHRLLQVERAKSERLLLNVLPQSIAERLKEREDVIADAFSHVTVLFADIVGFTPLRRALRSGHVGADAERAVLRLRRPGEAGRAGEDQDHRGRLHGGRWAAGAYARPRGGDRRHGPGDAGGGHPPDAAGRHADPAPDRHRLRSGGGGGHRATEVHLRPVG